MNKSMVILFFVILIGFSFADSDVLSSEQEQQLATLSEILNFVYEDNPSAIPTTEEDITTLEASTDSRDMFALTIFQMMKDVYEGKIDLSADQTVQVGATLQATTVEEQLDTNTEIQGESLITLETDKKIISNWGPIKFRKAKSLKECTSRASYFRDKKGTSLGRSLNEFSSHKLLRETSFLEQSQSTNLMITLRSNVSKVSEGCLSRITGWQPEFVKSYH